jgi:hypothetical protein
MLQAQYQQPKVFHFALAVGHKAILILVVGEKEKSVEQFLLQDCKLVEYLVQQHAVGPKPATTEALLALKDRLRIPDDHWSTGGATFNLSSKQSLHHIKKLRKQLNQTLHIQRTEGQHGYRIVHTPKQSAFLGVPV